MGKAVKSKTKKSKPTKVLKIMVGSPYESGQPKKIMNFHLPIPVIKEFQALADKHTKGNKTRFLLAAIRGFSPRPEDYVTLKSVKSAKS